MPAGGSLDAHAALGEMAEAGEGLPGGRPDPAAAARHYAAAAAGGHRDATTAYAYLLVREQGTRGCVERKMREMGAGR